MAKLKGLVEEEVLFHASTASLPSGSDEEQDFAQQFSLSSCFENYPSSKFGRVRAIVEIPSKEALFRIVSSGTVWRLDPVGQIGITASSKKFDFKPLPADLSGEPIVGIVDGGCSDKTYDRAEAWSAPALVPDKFADHMHGDAVTAITVHGHVWNPDLFLPKIFCRVGTAQAIPGLSAQYALNLAELISYLEGTIKANPNTRVWNMSFNEIIACHPDQVSFLGHEITRLARLYNILPVISAGNKSLMNDSRIAPPADCEAALVVGGRKPNDQGKVGDACDESLPGPGPDGMLKPDLSWYSTLRASSDAKVTGTSFATPLISSPFCPCVSKFKASYSRFGQGAGNKQNREQEIRSCVGLGGTE